MNLPNQLVCLSKQWIERFSYSVQIGSCSGYGKCRYKLWENKQTKRKENKSIASLRPASLPPIWIENVLMGCRDGAVVRAFASHHWPGSIPRSGVKCGLSLLVLCSAPRGFLRVLRFPLSSKDHHLT